MNIRTNKRHKVNEKHQQQASSKEKLLQYMQSKHAKEITDYTNSQKKKKLTKQNSLDSQNGRVALSTLHCNCK